MTLCYVIILQYIVILCHYALLHYTILLLYMDLIESTSFGTQPKYNEPLLVVHTNYQLVNSCNTVDIYATAILISASICLQI